MGASVCGSDGATGMASSGLSVHLLVARAGPLPARVGNRVPTDFGGQTARVPDAVPGYRARDTFGPSCTECVKGSFSKGRVAPTSLGSRSLRATPYPAIQLLEDGVAVLGALLMIANHT